MHIRHYRIESTVHQSERSLIYRATDDKKGKSLILKLLRSHSPADIAGYMQAYNVGLHLARHGVYGRCRMEKHGNLLMLIFDDTGAISLEQHLLQPFPPDSALSLSIAITEAVQKVHQAGIIHRNINPSNLIIHTHTGQVAVIDFSTASILPNVEPFPHHSHSSGTAVAYISPEQTGRMNRSVDYRTDYYALGVTLYQLFSNGLPFASKDPLELIHCHIARKPEDLHIRCPHIPADLSLVVMKLMSKNPEDRYQSLKGILSDLRTCRDRWRQNTVSPFTPGQRDIPEKFQICQKLYGRSREVSLLVAAFEEASCGNNRSVFIGGYPGCGKTALVREIYKPITRSWGYFIQGKFDQLQGSTPYSALAQAFSGLIRHYLGLGEEALAIRRQHLASALGAFGQIIIDRLPDLALILGSQPPVPEVGMSEARNRFQFVFKQFLMACCEPGRPLTLFLDDLQWADPSSIDLITQIASDKDIRYFFLIGSFRDNEVTLPHPLLAAMDEIRSKNPSSFCIMLEALKKEDLGQMIGDSLLRPADTVGELTELIQEKTAGNPFFVNQFLGTLHEEKALRFNPLHQTWDYDLSHIRRMGITCNVADLMIGKLSRLPRSTRHLLSRAACIGNSFTIGTLAIIEQSRPETIFNGLMPATAAGLIQALSEPEPAENKMNSPMIINQYRFLHDRVQEAAYAMIPTEEKAGIHLQAGRLMKASDPDCSKDTLFDVIRHLNAGAGLMMDNRERLNLADLNLTAARTAKTINAFDTALAYAKTGLSLLPEQAWLHHHSLWLELMFIQADCEVFQGHFSKGEALLSTMLQGVDNEMDRSRIHERQLQIHITGNRMEEALLLCSRVLSQWNIILKTDPSEKDWLNLDRQFRQLMADRAIQDLTDLPPIQNARMEAVLRLLITTLPASVQTRSRRPWCMICLITTVMNIGLQYGHSELSAHAYAAYSCCITEQHRYDEAWQFGRMALALNQKQGNSGLRGRLFVYFSMYTQFWKEPFTQCDPLWQECYQATIEAGDLLHVAFLLLNTSSLRFARSALLPELYEEASQAIAMARKTTSQPILPIIQMHFNLICSLMGKTRDQDSLDTEILTEQDFLAFMKGEDNAMGLAFYHTIKLIQTCYFSRWEQALYHGRAFEEFMLSVPGMVILAEHGFYFALAIGAVFHQLDRDEKNYYEERLSHYREHNRIWAENCPENFLCRHLLLEAENARLQKHTAEALRLYAEAAADARKNKFLNIEALSNESAARFWSETGYASYGDLHSGDALLGYRLWGADAKAAALQQHTPGLCENRLPGNICDNDTRLSSIPLPDSRMVDLDAILRVTRAISGEIVLERLLQTLMTAVLESTGAEYAILLAPRPGGGFAIEARAHTRWQNEDKVKTGPEIQDITSYPLRLAQYVAQSGNHLVMDDARLDHDFAADGYILSHQPLSVLCLPIRRHSKLLGLLYLENNLTTGAFRTSHISLLKTLCSQAAISLENARLYEQVQEYSRTLEERVAERTAQLEQLNLRLQELAHQDGLTGVANRRHCDSYLERIWNSLKRRKFPLSVIMCDVDFFKKYNDTYGHQKGDDCLIAVAHTLRSGIHRPEDFLARYGGEEFILILPETDEKGAEKVADTIRMAVKNLAMEHAGSPIAGVVTVSAGTATIIPSDSFTAEDLVREADAALYRAKEKGRNCVVSAPILIFSP
ncbi:diguanylate cyclase [Desulfobotulus sp. H1]|uniref:Diguanylate cyclase n=1 Tax=Desulfobotulus pelophilus TaxID=2823377 RepID=A0ABT3N688_9BACT|nr:diguanylate cyclase [Desulfobotulus pelophilus]MCW7752977.1 diguanylate cyclase [Desulfobotulus pelophilus]